MGRRRQEGEVSVNAGMTITDDRDAQYGFHSLTPAEGGHNPFGGLGAKGNMRVQCLRSSGDWSSGILTEHSIQTAYCQLIMEASHFIYMSVPFSSIVEVC